MAVKASTQVSIVDISDAYNVILSSEAYTFVGDTAGAPAGLSCETQVVAYCGGNQCDSVYIGSITRSNGISVSVSNNRTKSPTITFKTTGVLSSSCEVVIPVTVDGVTVNKKFTFSVAKTGNGIKDVKEHYAVSDSNTVTPTNWFDDVLITDSVNKYLWYYETITYTNGTTEDTKKRVIGTYGDKGDNFGWNLIKGTTTPIVDKWKGNGWGGSFLPYGEHTYKLVAENGWHMARYIDLADYAGQEVTISFYAKNISEETTATNAYRLGISNNAGSNPYFNDYFGFAQKPEQDVWTYYKYTIPKLNDDGQLGIGSLCYPENSNYKSTWLIKNLKLELGSEATIWTPHPDDLNGADGKGIKSTSITYQASSSGTAVPTGTWQTSVPTVSAGQFLWTRTVIIYTDNTTSTSYSIGKIGTNGTAGKGIKSTAITYQAGASGTAIPTGTWETQPPTTSAAKPYFWTRTVITYTDNTTSTSYNVGSTPDSVQVGGRNLQLGSAKWDTTAWNVKGAITVDGDTAIMSADARPSCSSIEVNINSVYTVSIDVKADVTGTITPDYGLLLLGFYNESSELAESIWVPGQLTSEWNRIVYTFTVPNNKNIKYLSVGLRNVNGIKNIYFRYLKVEKGNKATDWTPAPEDIQSDIKGVSNKTDEAAKTATNFMGFESGTGLQIGNKTNGTWKGFRSRITDTAFEILNEAGSAVASYGRKLIQLGKDSTDAVIELCGGKGSIKYSLITPEYENESARRYGLTMTSDDISLVSDGTGKTAGSGWIEMKSRKDDYGVNTSMENVCRVSGNSVELSSFMTDTETNAINGYCGVNGSIEGGLDLFAHGGKTEGLEAIRYNSVSFLNLFFPVGYVYMSYGDATSPAQLFGGTWEQIKGKFLYCNEGTATGGSTNHQHWQTIGLDYGDGLLYTNSGNKVTKSRVVTGQMCSYKYDEYGANNSTREDATYEASSMPPYVTVYAWVRTA